jgi:hypothetical protein
VAHGRCRLQTRPSTRGSVNGEDHRLDRAAQLGAFDNKTHGKEPRGFPSPRPVAPWSLGAWGQSRIDFPSDQQVVAPILTLPRLAGRSEANCRITISVAFLPQKIAPLRTGDAPSGRLFCPFPYQLGLTAARRSRVGVLHFVARDRYRSLLVGPIPIRKRAAFDVKVKCMIRLIDGVGAVVRNGALHHRLIFIRRAFIRLGRISTAVRARPLWGLT